jgi:predicted secreted protein
MIHPKKEIAISNQITLLVEAINCDNHETARLLVRRALNVVYDNKKSQWSFDDKADVEVDSSEFDAVVALIRSVKPKDSVEGILAAQFVALHLQ